jgi:plastocyanin
VGATVGGETTWHADAAEAPLLTTASTPQQIDVLMRDNLFDPREATVTTGGTVTWHNVGRVGHNSASVFPDQTFNGPRIITGETFSRSFTSPDVYHYECVFHPGMVGTITVVTDGAPAAPTIGRATVGIGSATVTWTPPEGTQDSPVIGYRVRVNSGLGVFVRDVAVPAAQATWKVVAGLRRDTAYRFEVAALNDVGQSLFSALSTVVVTPRPPFAPRIVRAAPGTTGGARTAVARWRRPLNNGGSAITGYVVTALRLSRLHGVSGRVRSPVLPADARSRVFRLRPGHYRFVVTARNAVGSGVRSGRSNLVTPR